MRPFNDLVAQSSVVSRCFYGGAVLSEDGQETPITETMVQRALASLVVAELVDRTRRDWLESAEGC